MRVSRWTAAGGRGSAIVAAAAILAAAVVVAAPAGLTSVWRTENVAVDGLPADWPKLEPLERGPAVGAVNDDEFLHLAVSTNDPQLLGLVASGLIVWIDPAGGRAQTFGLWVPGVVRPLLPGMNPAAPAAPCAGRDFH